MTWETDMSKCHVYVVTDSLNLSSDKFNRTQETLLFALICRNISVSHMVRC